MIIAAPVLTQAPKAAQAEILDEFGTLVSRGFVDVTAKAYLSAPSAAQTLLKSRVAQLDPRMQTLFAKALESLRR
jgi:predicted amidohydrolase